MHGLWLLLIIYVIISEDESCCTCWKQLECNLPFVNTMCCYLSVVPLK